MSSDVNQINAALERLFNEEGQRIVFWNDPEREFQRRAGRKMVTVPIFLINSPFYQKPERTMHAIGG